MKTKEQKLIEQIKDYVSSSHDFLSTRSDYSRGYSTGITQCKSIILDIIDNTVFFNDEVDTLREFQLMANDICQRLLTNTPVTASLLQEFADSANLVLNCFNAVKATMLAFPPEIIQDLNSHLNILNYGKHNVNSNEREG